MTSFNENVRKKIQEEMQIKNDDIMLLHQNCDLNDPDDIYTDQKDFYSDGFEVIILPEIISS